MLIPCPWCGDREDVEFKYGGSAQVAYPADPASVDDATTAREIARAWKTYGRVICPHTAVALNAARSLPRGDPVIALSTAHPAKFPDFVKQALGFEPEAPDRLKAVMDKPERLAAIDATIDAARAAVL